MNAVLLYPRFPETFWSLKHTLKFIRKRATVGSQVAELYLTL